MPLFSSDDAQAMVAGLGAGDAVVVGDDRFDVIWGESGVDVPSIDTSVVARNIAFDVAAVHRDVFEPGVVVEHAASGRRYTVSHVIETEDQAFATVFLEVGDDGS